MAQSKRMRRIETTSNIGSGFIVAWLLTLWILPVLLNLDLTAGWEVTLITSVYTAVSWVRSYFWRRFFVRRENGNRL